MMALGRAEILKKKHTQDKVIKQAFKQEEGDAKKVV
jgi:outer membrane protein assembly factor BamA